MQFFTVHDMIIAIVIAALGSTGLFTFITFLINRHDSKKGVLAELKKAIGEVDKRLDKIELDTSRCQLLILMNHYKNDKREILKQAEHYFAELNGDFYMTSLFCKWLKKNDIEKPIWFDSSK